MDARSYSVGIDSALYDRHSHRAHRQRTVWLAEARVGVFDLPRLELWYGACRTPVRVVLRELATNDACTCDVLPIMRINVFFCRHR